MRRAIAVLAILSISPGVAAQPLGDSGERQWVVGLVDDADHSIIPLPPGFQSVAGDARLNMLVVRGPAAQEHALLTAARHDNRIRYVADDGPIVAAEAVNDPYFPQQWGLRHAGVVGAWNTSIGTTAVKLAILDAGADPSDPDLGAALCQRGADYTGHNWSNLNSHGHAVASLASAAQDNGVGIAGATVACVHDIRVLGPDGTGSWSSVALGLVNAVEAGDHIALMSFVGKDSPPVVRDAAKLASYAGMLLIAAAGNTGCPPAFPPDQVLEPARFDEVMAVAALQLLPEEHVSWYSRSSCGPSVEIAAPGANVITATGPATYETRTGTSYAAPLVAATAALMKGRHPQLSGLDLRCGIDMRAQVMGVRGFDILTGFGALDAEGAVGRPLEEHERSVCAEILETRRAVVSATAVPAPSP